MPEQVGILTCPNTDCDYYGTEFERPAKFCPICGTELQIITYPETEDNDA